MYYLAVDCAAGASVAIVTGHDTIATRHTEDTRSHSEVLAGYVAEVLEEASLGFQDLQAVFAGVGPGPFTGLRVGVLTAATLADSWGIPCYGVMSLDALAEQAVAPLWREGYEELVVATDARRHEVYWAHYELIGGQSQRLHGPFVTSAEDVTRLPVVGAGAGLYPDALHAVPGWDRAQPLAEFLGHYGIRALRRGRGLEPVTPMYLRGHDAHIPAAMRHG